jgi:hypothetical protein
MTEKVRGRPFAPGTSGNPKGRPPGSGKVAELREKLAKDVPDIIKKLVEQAKAGDPSAARLILERVVPAVKPVEMPAFLDLPADGSLTDHGRAILGAAGLGDIPPGQASQLLSGLAALAKLIETDELAARIAALEEANASKR